MIEFTREEVLNLLKTFSIIEGFLMGAKDGSNQYILEELEYPADLLTKKLLGDE
jgi:hypothetical protein